MSRALRPCGAHDWHEVGNDEVNQLVAGGRGRAGERGGEGRAGGWRAG